jgi:ectoine hydroxylase-related dioxygenase (phytanoyl-CoA dioxygenase family)
MVLEGSHRIQELRSGYGRTDVDTYCENRFDGTWLAPDGTRNRPDDATGYLSQDHPGLRERLGGRWLTAEYRAGDLLAFGMYTAHASIDNRTDRWRLSTDSRYQLASEAVDERWVGENPIAHGPDSKKEVIC